MYVSVDVPDSGTVELEVGPRGRVSFAEDGGGNGLSFHSEMQEGSNGTRVALRLESARPLGPGSSVGQALIAGSAVSWDQLPERSDAGLILAHAASALAGRSQEDAQVLFDDATAPLYRARRTSLDPRVAVPMGTENSTLPSALDALVGTWTLSPVTDADSPALEVHVFHSHTGESNGGTLSVLSSVITQPNGDGAPHLEVLVEMNHEDEITKILLLDYSPGVERELARVHHIAGAHPAWLVHPAVRRSETEPFNEAIYALILAFTQAMDAVAPAE